MKTEHDFNAHLSKKLRELQPHVFHVKVSDKYHIGLSDFLIWKSGVTLALEAKFVKKRPPSGRMLNFAFKPAQITFLKQMEMAGNLPFGLVAIGEERTMFPIPLTNIPAGGNWDNDRAFREACFSHFHFDDVTSMLEVLIGMG
jgi:penicillin-binding protein-related factor A (putative recombinase)